MHDRRHIFVALGASVVLLAVFAVGSALPFDPLLTSQPGWAEGVSPAPAPSVTLVQPEPPPDAGEPHTSTSLGDALLLVLGIALIVALVVLLLTVVMRAARLVARRSHAPAEIDEIAVEPTVSAAAVADIVEQARLRIAVDGDVNRVVVHCWEALERLAADAGIPRQPHETAGEYVVGMLATLDLPAAPAQRLAGLYEAALFASGRLPSSAVDDATEALDLLDAALARERRR